MSKTINNLNTNKDFFNNLKKVVSGTSLSRFFGLIRDISTTNLFGASVFHDIFVICLKIPNLFRRFFAEGAFNQAFVPLYSEYEGKQDNVRSQEFLNAIPEVIFAIESYDTTTVRASVGNYLVAKYIKEHTECKVIFNGDGSDELCGGYLYMHCAPNALEFDLECKRLLNEICYFDVLRSDRSISTNGLEPRTPFLDRGWVEVYLSIPKEVRFHVLHKLPEKYLLRKAFDNGGYLPDNILWRTKEAFSDGVSSLNRSWYTIIDEKVKVILVNIFAGINRCDWVAEGIVQALEKIEIKVPLVIRLAGTNVEKGNKILQDSKLNYIEANTLEDAANKAVAALK